MQRATFGIVGRVDESAAVLVRKKSCFDGLEVCWISIAHFDLVVEIHPVVSWLWSFGGSMSAISSDG